jgi:3,4-dihydroxy 2-butanone 4-phosphate synthase/GTP cyclohydrolase II
MAAGGMVLVVDDESREDEGDLIMGASFATAESMAFFLRCTSGYICVAMPGEWLDRLELPMMVAHNTTRHATPMTVTVDVASGTTTGVSARDRALTARALSDPSSVASDFLRPGHIQPLRAAPNGVLERNGHTEAGVDLARLAGIPPVAVICEVTDADKRGIADRRELRLLSRTHDIPLISVADLVAYRRAPVRGASARLPRSDGNLRCVSYNDGATTHLALVAGTPEGKHNVLTRVHSECVTGEAFGSLRCDCREQLEMSLSQILDAGEGVVLYLRGHEGRGIGLAEKLLAYQLQDGGLDTFDANTSLGFPPDGRDYSVAAGMLRDLDVASVRLLTNNPGKCDALLLHGIDVVERLPIESKPNLHNLAYLRAKAERMGHLLRSHDLEKL